MIKMNLKITALMVCMTAGIVNVHAAVIYGLESGRNFKSEKKDSYTIQVGTFHSKANAHRLEKQLSAYTSYPVRVMFKYNLYHVSIENIPNAQEVRAVSAAYLSGNTLEKKKRSLTHHTHKTTEKPETSSISVRNTVPSDTLINAVMPSLGNGHWFGSIDGGGNWYSLNTSMNVNNGSGFASPLNQDYFSATSDSASGMVGLSAGYLWENKLPFFDAYSLALRYQHLFSQSINGNILQYSLPEFTNYQYHWKMDFDVLSAQAKVYFLKNGPIAPYVDVGLGASWNHTSDYSEVAYAGVTPRINPNYGSHTNTQFAYNVGAGLDFTITAKVNLFVGYDFQSLGTIQSAAGQSTWASTSLHLNDIENNTWLVGINYLFG